jgi:hypothetical protein
MDYDKWISYKSGPFILNCNRIYIYYLFCMYIIYIYVLFRIYIYFFWRYPIWVPKIRKIQNEFVTVRGAVRVPMQMVRVHPGKSWFRGWDVRVIPRISLCWLTYPSEKWWSSSVGMMTFPINMEKSIKIH